MLDVFVMFATALAAYAVGAFAERHMGRRPSSNADIAERVERLIEGLDRITGATTVVHKTDPDA